MRGVFFSSDKPSGHIFVDGNEVAQTMQCGHCSTHWEVVHGSGRKRGWCNGCNKPLCGKALCMKYCAPLKARFEFFESMSSGDFKNAKRLLELFPGIDKLAL